MNDYRIIGLYNGYRNSRDYPKLIFKDVGSPDDVSSSSFNPSLFNLPYPEPAGTECKGIDPAKLHILTTDDKAAQEEEIEGKKRKRVAENKEKTHQKVSRVKRDVLNSSLPILSWHNVDYASLVDKVDPPLAASHHFYGNPDWNDLEARVCLQIRSKEGLIHYYHINREILKKGSSPYLHLLADNTQANRLIFQGESHLILNTIFEFYLSYRPLFVNNFVNLKDYDISQFFELGRVCRHYGLIELLNELDYAYYYWTNEYFNLDPSVRPHFFPLAITKDNLFQVLGLIISCSKFSNIPIYFDNIFSICLYLLSLKGIDISHAETKNMIPYGKGFFKKIFFKDFFERPILVRVSRACENFLDVLQKTTLPSILHPSTSIFYRHYISKNILDKLNELFPLSFQLIVNDLDEDLKCFNRETTTVFKNLKKILFVCVDSNDNLLKKIRSNSSLKNAIDGLEIKFMLRKEE